MRKYYLRKIVSIALVVCLSLAGMPAFNFAADERRSSYIGEVNENAEENVAQSSSPITADRKEQSLIVKFKGGKTENEAATALSSRMRAAGLLDVASNLEIEEVIDRYNIAVVSIGENDDMQSAINALSIDKDVEYVQQDYILLPNSDTWAIRNEGQIVNGVAGVAGVDINVEPVHEGDYAFSEIVVAELGTGVDTSHESLTGRYVSGYNFVDMNTTVFSNGDSAHGTQIAALIAGGEMANGFRGVAGNVKIMPLKFIEDGYGYTSDAIAAIEFAVDNGAKIINCGWGSSVNNPVLKGIMQENMGTLFVCAAGNNGNTKNIYPAAFNLPNVISVASIDNTGNLAQTSNYGSSVDLAAPGKDIYTAIPGDGYDFASGTSIATAFVSAAAALYMGESGKFAIQTKRAIANSATPNASLTDKVASGGMLNVAEMMEYEDDIVFDDPGDMEIHEYLLQLYTMQTFYTELSQEEKEHLETYLYLRQDTMTECAQAGYGLVESYPKALIMQKLNITLSQALTMITNLSEGVALCFAGNFNMLQREYEILNDYDKGYFTDLLIEGHEPRSIVCSYIAASALNIDHQNAISDSEPDFDEIDLSMYSGDELKAFIDIVLAYHLDVHIVLQYLTTHSIAPADALNQIAKRQLELNMFVEYGNRPMSDDEEITETLGKEQAAPFAIMSSSSENINPQNGMLTYDDHIASIPGRNGFDLNLTLRYDSQFSSTDRIYGKNEPIIDYVSYHDLYVTNNPIEYYNSFGGFFIGRYSYYYSAVLKGMDLTTGSGSQYQYYWVKNVPMYEYTGQATINEVEENGMYGETPFESMGVGWAFNFPRVVMDDQTKEKSLRLADGSTYKYSNGATYSNLKDYLLKDMIFEEDPNGQYKGSKYVLTHIDGTKEYFDGKGRIAGIRDKFNNTIDFDYNITGSYEGNVTITDSANQVTSINYNNAGVTITLPDASEVEYSFVTSGIYTLLNSKTDQMNRVTSYGYDAKTAYFDFFSTNSTAYASSSGRGDTANYFLNLVAHPSGATTNYVYSVADGAFETKGFYQYYRVSSRYDLADNVSYNIKSYSYSNNNYTGFPTNNGAWGLDSSFEYDAAVECGNGVVKQYKYNNKHLLVNDSLSHNNVKKTENNYTYDPSKQLLSHSTASYGLGGRRRAFLSSIHLTSLAI